jgi:glycosyltransferase involved in cell wall biosynthesis
MDLSVVDAARTGTFGYAGRSEDELQAHISDERRFLSACEGVVSLSTYAADSISRDLGYDRARIAPIGAGPALDAVPDVRFDPARYGAARVLFVGRDWERKGGRLILEGFRRLRTEVTHATLTVVGPSENPAPGEPGLVYVGALDKTKPSEAQKLQEFFLNSSLLCMASVSEPWGLVYVEAARYGLPVVALDTWAVPDIVVDGSTGVLIAEPEAEQLGDALRVVCTQPEASAQMGRAAKVRVESVLAWPAVVDRLLQHVLPASVSGREVLPLRGVATGAAVA